MSEFIYILSDPDSVLRNKFKVGITKRNKDLLLRDYRRSRPEVELYLFEACTNAKEIESNILNKFEKFRIKHESGKLSEWINYDLEKIIKYAREVLEGYQPIVIQNDYTIQQFLLNRCKYCNYYLLPEDYHESCKDLYDDYVSQGGSLSKSAFCRQLMQELVNYYRRDSNKLKLKVKGLVHYRGVRLLSNVPVNGGCVII
jgi:hypothetical protein